MKILGVLGLLEKIELEMSELYERLSHAFENDAEASGLFFRMAMQERAHARLLRYGKNLARQAPGDFAEVEVDAAEIDRMLESVRTARVAAPPTSLQKAVALALRFEESPAESAHRSILMSSNLALSAVFRNLAVADEEHAAGLRAFAARRALASGPPAAVDA